MIPELALWAAPARAEEPAEPAPAEVPAAPARPAPEGTSEPTPDGAATDLAKHRASFDVLVDRTIGTTSAPVEFDWRHTHVQLAGRGSFLVELNNFNSLAAGGLVRVPTSGGLLEVGLSGVEVWDTPSSTQLGFTPYRQPGRPPRGELDVTVGIPLAEGVVTVAPRWFPAVELVFVGYVGLRYSLYPTGFRHLKAGEVATALLSPTLSQEEVDNLEEARLAAMEVDRGRYGTTLGIGDDLYFKRGLFVSPRLTVSVPLLAAASQTKLLFWGDASLAVGVAF